MFIAWVVVSLIWLWITLCIANFYPLIDGGLKKIWQVLRWQTQSAEEQDISSSNSLNVDAAGVKGLEEVRVSEKSAVA